MATHTGLCVPPVLSCHDVLCPAFSCLCPQVMYQGECVAVNVMRVTNPVDIMSANQNPAVASLARDMGGDKFKLVPRGRLMSGRIPPAASSQAEPMVVCGNKTVAWRESYGPFTEYDCGPNMVRVCLADPTTQCTTSFTPALMRAVKQTRLCWQLRAHTRHAACDKPGLAASCEVINTAAGGFCACAAGTDGPVCTANHGPWGCCDSHTRLPDGRQGVNNKSGLPAAHTLDSAASQTAQQTSPTAPTASSQPPLRDHGRPARRVQGDALTWHDMT